MAVSKKQLLYEFSQTGQARNCKSIADLEERFSKWMRRNNINLESHGRSYYQNDFYSSADYTMTILAKDRNLLYSFGLNEKHLVKSKPEYRDNLKDGYSLKGQFKFYANQAHNRTQNGEYRKNGKAGFSGSGTFKVILVIIAIVVLYSLVGDTVWNMITSGAIFKFICFAIAGVASIGILRSKNMGWPLPIKLVVLFAIWVVLVNYDF